MITCCRRLALRSVGLVLFLVMALPPARANAASSVSVAANPEFWIGSEVGPTPAVFTLTRDGDLTSALSVRITFGGTAKPQIDYSVWETAEFAPGERTSYLAILPNNDAEREGWESVTLTIDAGDGYVIASPATATVYVTDAPAFQGFFEKPGVFDNQESVTDGLGRDILYLEAAIAGDSLHVIVWVNNPRGTNVEIFLDTDQNPGEGEFRHGYLGGIEYRATLVSLGFEADYVLNRMPQRLSDCPPPEQAYLGYYGVTCEQPVARGAAQVFDNGLLLVNIPLAAIGSPSAVDVSATAHDGAVTYLISGNGDRAPEFGVLDTRTGQVVVRRPARTRLSFAPDQPGALSGMGFDLTGAAFASIADQFLIQLRFAQVIDLQQLSAGPGLRAEVALDSDRSLTTGSIAMGNEIPTWGGDGRLVVDLSALSSLVELQIDTLGTGRAIFADTHNDGRWVARGNTVLVKASHSVYDAFVKTPYGSLRKFTDGRMIASIRSLEVNGSYVDSRPVDALPESGGAIDTGTGQVLAPFTWDATQTAAADAQEALLVSGQDLIGVRAQVIGEYAAVQALLGRWDPSEHGLIFEILVDTDLNEWTGERWENRQNLGLPIGAEWKIQISDLGSMAPTYVARIISVANGIETLHDAILMTKPSSEQNRGSFTVTIPLTWLTGAAPRCRLYVASGGWPYIGADTAPVEPLEVGLVPATR